MATLTVEAGLRRGCRTRLCAHAAPLSAQIAEWSRIKTCSTRPARACHEARPGLGVAHPACMDLGPGPASFSPTPARLVAAGARRVCCAEGCSLVKPVRH